MEYTHLLSSQMDSQRDFYESKLESCESDYASHIMDVNLRLDEESSKLRASEQTNHLNLAKIEKLVKKVGLTLKQKEDEETMNQILRKDRQTYKENILRLERVLRVKDEQVNELQEQVRDLMFFVESREKIDNDPELMNATIVHVDLPT